MTSYLERRCALLGVAVLLITLGCQREGVVDDDDTGDDDTESDDDDTAESEPNYALAFHGDGLGWAVETLSLDGLFTVELWVQVQGQVQGTLLCSGEDFDYWAIQHSPTSEILRWVQIEGGEVRGDQLGEGWHHVAVVGGVSTSLYVNGTLKASEELPELGLEMLPVPIMVGQRCDMDESWSLNGAVIDEIRISDVARYDQDFNPAPVFTTDSSTLLHWHFDEGQGDVASDEVSNLELSLSDTEWVQVERQNN